MSYTAAMSKLALLLSSRTDLLVPSCRKVGETSRRHEAAGRMPTAEFDIEIVKYGQRIGFWLWLWLFVYGKNIARYPSRLRNIVCKKSSLITNRHSGWIGTTKCLKSMNVFFCRVYISRYKTKRLQVLWVIILKFKSRRDGLCHG
jgi:hypothetical protein